MELVVGEHVVWTYRPRRCGSRPYYVTAEVVQPGRIRTRIRITTIHGHRVLRWVNPKNLRVQQPEEPRHLYPLPEEPRS